MSYSISILGFEGILFLPVQNSILLSPIPRCTAPALIYFEHDPTKINLEPILGFAMVFAEATELYSGAEGYHST